MTANINDILDIIEDMIEKSTKLPLSGGRCVIDGEQLSEFLADIRLNMPTEVKQAKLIVSDRKQIIDDARAEAEGIIRRSQERAKTLVAETEIIKQAQKQANEMMMQAQVQAKEVKRATSSFVEQTMQQAEEQLSKSLTEIKSTRQAMRAGKL